MYSKSLLFLALVAIPFVSLAQLPPLPTGKSMWASSVLDYQFGDNQTAGQLPVVFPQNVFSKPPTDASPDNPSYMQTDLASIGGDKGYISLGFNPPILNGPGFDFTVFENVLRVVNGSDTILYQEWMSVSASNDGITWFDFPFDTLSGEGFAGRKCTNGSTTTYKDAAKSGGDAFDLSVIGLDSAKYIRVTDATQYQFSEGSADLDAIAAIWQVGDNTTAGITNTYPIHAKIDVQGNEVFYCLNETCLQMQVYTLDGKLLTSNAVNSTCGQLILPHSGLYIIHFTTVKGQLVTKIVTQ